MCKILKKEYTKYLIKRLVLKQINNQKFENTNARRATECRH